LADLKVLGLTEIVEIGEKEVETFEQVADNGPVIGMRKSCTSSKGADPGCGVSSALESDTLVDVLQGLADDVIEEEAEECWSEDRHRC
jgi:hypothetical protein